MSRKKFPFWEGFALFVLLVLFSPVSTAQGSSSCSYKLPWASDLGKIAVTQGPGQGNHIGLFANSIDFDFVGGEDVLAVCAGTVTEVHEGESICGGSSKSEYSNYVIINHGGGEYSRYDHMMPEVPVRVGQDVKQGEIVGKVGNSGFTYCQTSAGGGTHLHFQLQTTGRGWGQSIPVSFTEISGSGIPQGSGSYLSQNKSVDASEKIVLDLTSPASIAKWLAHALATQDDSVKDLIGSGGTIFASYGRGFNPLGYNNGDEFAKDLKKALANSTPVCLGYKENGRKLNVVFSNARMDSRVTGVDQKGNLTLFLFMKEGSSPFELLVVGPVDDWAEEYETTGLTACQ